LIFSHSSNYLSHLYLKLLISRCPLSSSLPLHDALPIYQLGRQSPPEPARTIAGCSVGLDARLRRLDRPDPVVEQHQRVVEAVGRSEEHTSELQSRENLVCRLLLEKKKKNYGANV